MNAGSSGRLALSLCTAAALFEGFDNQSMGVAAPRVAAEFHMSAGQSGWVFSAATFGLFLGAMVGGRLADRFGRKRTLTVSLLLFGISSLLTAAVSGLPMLLVARLFTGIGLGAAMPNFIALASESTRAERRISAVTLVMAAMPLGGALAGLLALSAQWGWGWRSIFLAGGVGPVLLAGAVAAWLPGHEYGGDGSKAARMPEVEPVFDVLFGSSRAWTTTLLWTAFFFTQLVLLLMLNWLPSLIAGLGFTKAQASWASIAFNLSGSAGAGFLGTLHAGARRRLWVAITYAGMVAALAAVAAVGRELSIMLLSCAAAGVFIIGAQLILFALAPLYYPSRGRGTGVGAAVAAGRLGSVVGPLFAGTLLSLGGSSAAVLLAIVPFVAAGGSAAFALTWRRPSAD